MVENENETLRDRVSDLEKRVHDQNDEITCLRATLADALRRINSLESGKGQLLEAHLPKSAYFSLLIHFRSRSNQSRQQQRCQTSNTS